MILCVIGSPRVDWLLKTKYLGSPLIRMTGQQQKQQKEEASAAPADWATQLLAIRDEVRSEVKAERKELLQNIIREARMLKHYQGRIDTLPA